MRMTKVLVGTLMLGAASLVMAQSVRLDYDPRTDFSKYRTFALKEGTPAPSPLIQKRIEEALVAQLESKGLKRASGDGDLDVFTHVRVNVEKRVDFDTFGYRGYRGWGTTSANVTEVSVGTLIVDLVDSGRKELVWRGVATDTLPQSSTPEKSEKRIHKAMAKLFKKFPPPPAE